MILTGVRWYVAYPLSLRDLEDMMAERGVSVDHSTVHRWAVKLLPVLEKAFRLRKRPVGKSWRTDKTYIRVKSEWRYLYRAVDKDGNTIDFLLRAHRDKTAARRYLEKSIAWNGAPDTVTVEKNGANLAALDAINVDQDPPVEISQQPGRAGPSGDQATNATRAGFQEFSLCPDPSCRHRVDAHDRERADAVCSRNLSVRR